MRKGKINIIVKHILSALALLVAASTILVSFVFAKYTSEQSQTIDLNVYAYGGNIDLSLTEGNTSPTALWADADHELFALPGATPTFNPYVHMQITDNARGAFLFVMIEAQGGEVTAADGTEYGFSDFVTYTIAEGWTQGTGIDIPKNVYYREISTAEDTSRDLYFQIFKNNAVIFLDTAPEKAYGALTDESTPRFTVSAYAVEKTVLGDDISVANATAEGAWAYASAIGQPPEVDLPPVDIGGTVTPAQQ